MSSSKSRFRIGTVEEMTGLTRDAIHVYVRDKLVGPPERASKTGAWYTLEQVRTLRVIRTLRDASIPLPVIDRLLRQHKGIVKLSAARLGLLGAALGAAGVREIRRSAVEDPSTHALGSILGVSDRLNGNAALVESLTQLAHFARAAQWAEALKKHISEAISQGILRDHPTVGASERPLIASVMGAVLSSVLLERTIDEVVESHLHVEVRSSANDDIEPS